MVLLYLALMTLWGVVLLFVLVLRATVVISLLMMAALVHLLRAVRA